MQSIRHFALIGFCSAVDGIDAESLFDSRLPKTVNGNVIFQHPSRIHLTITLTPIFLQDCGKRPEFKRNPGK